MPAPNALKLNEDYSAARTNAVVCFTASADSSSIPAAIDILRGGVWFEALRACTGQRSAYGVGKRVQPHTYRPRSEGRWPQHHNLWAKYARGIHLPGRETVRAANQVCPGSGDLLTVAAWDALEVSTPLGIQGDALLRRLRIGVQQAVFDPRWLEAGHYERRTTPVRPLLMLQGQADLDGVAALVILLREAHEAGDHARAFAIGRSLHAALLTATTFTPLLFIASELFEFFNRVIFPLASDEDMTLDLDRDEFHEQRVFLNRTFLQLEDAGRINPERGTTRAHRDILTGRFGFDLLFGLGPRWRLIQSTAHASEEARSFVGSMRVARDWGLGVLRRGQRVRLLPDEVAAQMAAAR